MVKVPELAPNADALLMFKVPAVKVTPLVKVFVPPSVSVPEPDFVMV